jgi:hypothetical protein
MVQEPYQGYITALCWCHIASEGPGYLCTSTKRWRIGSSAAYLLGGIVDIPRKFHLVVGLLFLSMAIGRPTRCAE